MNAVSFQSPPEFLAALPSDGRAAPEVIRKATLDNLSDGNQEIVDFGMLAYVIPLEDCPKAYNGHRIPGATHGRVPDEYLGNTETGFTEAYRASGRKLDMRNSCVRFKLLDDMPVELVGQVIVKTSPRVGGSPLADW